MTPAACFRFLVCFTQLLAERYPHDPVFDPTQFLVPGQPTPTSLVTGDGATTHNTLTAMWNVLQTWPAPWYAVLERIAADEEQNKVAEQTIFPVVLFGTSMLRSTAFAWLHHSWGHWMYEHVGHVPGVFRWYRLYESVRRRLSEGRLKLPAFLLQAEASALSGAGLDTYRQYLTETNVPVRRGHVEGRSKGWHLVTPDVAEQLRQQHAQQLPFADAKAYLELGQYALSSLLSADLIIPEQRHPDKQQWRFTRASLDGAMDALIGHLPVQPAVPNTTDALNLAQALAVLRPQGADIAELLVAARDGAVATWRVAATVALRDVRFLHRGDGSLLAYRDHVHLRVDKPEYIATEVCQLLNCTHGTLQRWRAANLLVPCRERSESTREDVMYAQATLTVFQDQYMLTDEMAAFLGCHEHTVQKWARDGRLVPAVVWGGTNYNTYLFDRKFVTEVIVHQVRTVEAAAILGTTERTFCRWVQQGLLHPVGNAGSIFRWFDRSDLERVRKTLRINPRTGKPYEQQQKDDETG